jgi:hypothetical protein
MLKLTCARNTRAPRVVKDNNMKFAKTLITLFLLTISTQIFAGPADDDDDTPAAQCVSTETQSCDLPETGSPSAEDITSGNDDDDAPAASDEPSGQAIPEPSIIALFSAGLFGLVIARSRRRKLQS